MRVYMRISCSISTQHVSVVCQLCTTEIAENAGESTNGRRQAIDDAGSASTTVHRGPDGACSVVLTNMSPAPLDLTGWTLTVDAGQSTALPASILGPDQPTSLNVPASGLANSGGVLMLVNPGGLSVHCVAYPGGDPAAGWSASLG